MKKRILILILATIPCTLGIQCGIVVHKSPQAPPASLSEQLDALFSDADLNNAFVGVAVWSEKRSTFVYRKNDDLSFMPGSNLKLCTTATALELLGPECRTKTEYYLDGDIVDSLFIVDIIITGYGDPTLQWRHSLGGVEQFQSFAQQLAALGVKAIQGRVIGDDNAFDDQEYGIGWSWENGPFWYQAPISALSLHGNCVDFEISAGDSVGAAATVRHIPPTSMVALNSQITTSLAKDSIDIHREKCSNNFYLRGAITIGKHLKKRRTIDNPTLYTLSVLLETIKRSGIIVDASIDDIDNLEYFHYDTTFQAASFYSPPLREIVYDINKKSLNLDAELLLKITGMETAGKGSALAGAGVMEEYWKRRGLDFSGVHLADGSGLSRKNLVTPQSIVELLRAMRNNIAFYDSLPISGIDGTLEQRMTMPGVDARVHAKTGPLDFVKALSGYLKSNSGDEIVFSCLVNHALADAHKIAYIQDRMCEILVQQ